MVERSAYFKSLLKHCLFSLLPTLLLGIIKVLGKIMFKASRAANCTFGFRKTLNIAVAILRIMSSFGLLLQNRKSHCLQIINLTFKQWSQMCFPSPVCGGFTSLLPFTFRWWQRLGRGCRNCGCNPSHHHEQHRSKDRRPWFRHVWTLLWGT